MSKKRKISLYIPAEIHNKLLSLANKNKIINLDKGLKDKNKKPGTITDLIIEAINKIYMK